jgi:hypothetical protein
MKETFSPAQAAYAAGIPATRIVAIRESGRVQLDCAATHRKGCIRRYTHADVYALALLEAARAAGFTPGRAARAVGPALEMSRLRPSGLARLLAGMHLEVMAGNERLASIDLGNITSGVERRIAEIHASRNIP